MDKSWKAFERRMCKDVGTTRIPVTAERHGADGATARFCYQFKLRKVIPAFLFEWLSGIVGTATHQGKLGVVVMKRPRQQDLEAVVLLRWADWVKVQRLLDEARQPSYGEIETVAYAIKEGFQTAPWHYDKADIVAEILRLVTKGQTDGRS